MAELRQIHVVWLGSPVPPRIRALERDLQSMNPRATIRVWTDPDLAWLVNRDELLAEPRMSGKANIARYEILLRHGGIYLDADFRAHRPLDSVFEAINRFGLVVARQSRVVFNPAFIAARAEHPALKRAVEGIPTSRLRFCSASSPARTGPHYFTSVLLDHVRAGGTFGELPQHAIFPWYLDEQPVADQRVPASVVVSHEWATMHGDRFWNSSDSERVVAGTEQPKPLGARASWRARVASTPLSHEVVRRLERALHAGGIDARVLGAASSRNPSASAPEQGLAPGNNRTDSAIDAWTARLVARTVRGSDSLLDVNPTSFRTFLTALRVLNRSGRAILVTAPGTPRPHEWRDPSVRCSAHVLTVDPLQPDRIVRIESEGSALVPYEISPDHGPLGRDSEIDHTLLSKLVGEISRFALIRCDADSMTDALSETLSIMLESQRIRDLIISINPMSVQNGIASTLAFLQRQADSGRSISLGPWIMDGRGRAWDEHIRVAARPFLVRVH